MEEIKYISADDAAAQINVNKATLYYYIRRLKLETHKFELDKHAYLTHDDFRKIKIAKDQARQRSKPLEEENPDAA